MRDALAGEGREVSVREVRRALHEGRILIDGRARAPGDRARGGEEVELGAFVPRGEAELEPERELLVRAPLLFEDDRLLALAKPSGMPTAPLRPGEMGTLLGVAVARCPAIARAGPPLEGGLVHRLDVGTSGVVLFAKELAVREAIRAEFSRGAIEKRYLALAEDPRGVLGFEARVLDGWIGPGHSKDRVRVSEPEREGAQAARTEVRVLERLGDRYAWVEAIAHTGRRHQIRAHLAHAGAPIVGDPIYGQPGGEGEASDLLPRRLALHASRLMLPRGPTITAELPEDLAAPLRSLGGLQPR